MSISTSLTALQTAKTDIANAITAKGGTVAAGDGFSDFAADIGTITGGGGIPTPPEDGKTRLYFSILSRKDVKLNTYLYAAKIEIDWGDGSQKEIRDSVASNRVDTATHNYSSSGDYVITIALISGTYTVGGNGSSYPVFSTSSNKYTLKYAFLRGVTAVPQYAFQECFFLEYISLPAGLQSIGREAFNGCCALDLVDLPVGITTIGLYAFANCVSLKSIALPLNITTLNERLLYGCYAIKSITLPSGLLSIVTSSLSNLRSLQELTIPASVTTIANYAMQYAYSMRNLTMLPTTPPTLGGANVFDIIPSDCTIYVPVGSLTAYQTATNWSSHSAKMKEIGT